MAVVTLTRLVDRLRPWNAPLEIPECPRGWETGPPTYVGIGAQRCGTSWWYDSMRRHPRIRRSPLGKEVHYFDRFWQRRRSRGHRRRVRARCSRDQPRPAGRRVDAALPGRFLGDPPPPQGGAGRPHPGHVPGSGCPLPLGDREAAADGGGAAGTASAAVDRRRDLARLLLPAASPRVRAVPPRAGARAAVRALRARPVGEMERTWRFVGVDPPAEPPERLLKHRQAGRGHALSSSRSSAASWPSATERIRRAWPSSAPRSTCRCGRTSRARAASGTPPSTPRFAERRTGAL